MALKLLVGIYQIEILHSHVTPSRGGGVTCVSKIRGCAIQMVKVLPINPEKFLKSIPINLENF